MVVAVIPAFAAVILAALERFPSFRFRHSRLFRRYVTGDVIYLLTGYVAGGSLAVAFIADASNLLGASLGVPRLSSANLPLWVTAPAALVALDLGNYVAHNLLHRYPALWEFHKVHHSIESLDWLATFRSHIVEQTLRRLVAPLLLIIAGFPADAVALAGGVFLAWSVANHSNLALNLGFIEPLFVTPRLHRLHHVPETDGRNFGTVFTLWDRMRGTLVVREASPDARFGFAGQGSYPHGWLRQLVEPFRALARSEGIVSAGGERPANREPRHAGRALASAASGLRPGFGAALLDVRSRRAPAECCSRRGDDETDDASAGERPIACPPASGNCRDKSQ